MKPKLISATSVFWFLSTLVVFSFSGVRAQAGGLKLEAQLVWGTDDPKSSDPRHKPVEPEIRKKLKELPLKWSNYFEVNRAGFDVSPAETKRVPMSEKCAVEVKNLGNSTIEVALVGKGREVVKRTQSLARGEILVLGGNAPNATAWLVILKRME